METYSKICFRGRAGYFSKMILMLASTLKMSKTISDCDTRHLVEYDVKNVKILNKLNGKYYKMDYSDDDYKIIDANKDGNLIGKKILARSVATCALGDCCCAKCIGSTAALNIDIPDGIGAFNSDEVTKVVEQSILSTNMMLCARKTYLIAGTSS